MTMPPPAGGFTLEPDGLEALAHELALLSGEVSEHAERSRSAAFALGRALDGIAGSSAGAAATGWAALEELLADRTRSVSQTLQAAVAAYLAEDLYLSATVGSRRPR